MMTMAVVGGRSLMERRCSPFRPPRQAGARAVPADLRRSADRNVENAIDRAVLLAEDGVVRRLDLRASPSRLREVPAPVAVQRSPTPVMTSPALPSGRRVRSGVSEAEFLEAWEAAGGHAVTVAERLGVRERSVYRLKKRFLPD